MCCVTSLDGAPVFANRAWIAFTGVSLERFRASGWAAVLAPADDAALQRARREADTTSGAFRLHLRVRRFDETLRQCAVHGELMPSPHEGAERWIVWIVDTHEQRSRQAELAAALQRRDACLSAYAHDLRNPLQTMRHSVYALQLSDHSPAGRPQLLQVLERQIEVLARRTQQYIDEWRMMSEGLPSEMPSEMPTEMLARPDALPTEAKPELE